MAHRRRASHRIAHHSGFGRLRDERFTVTSAGLKTYDGQAIYLPGVDQEDVPELNTLLTDRQ